MRKSVFILICAASCIWGQEGTGPFPAVMEQDPGLPTHTIYRPKDLAGLQGQKLPIVAWGEGGCSNNGAFYKNFLGEIASHGYLAIAVGPPQAPQPAGNRGAAPAEGRGAANPGGAPAPGRGGPATKSSQLTDAINWAVGENGRKDSPYYNRLDTSKIAVMGHSCGGIQALAVGADPRIKLIGNWSGGLFVTPPAGAGAAMENVPKEQLDKLHSPVFYISGDSTDIAFANSNDDFKRITKVPAFRAYKDGVGHGGTYTQPNGGDFGKVAVALLAWQFKGDQEAGKMFLGADCGLCKDPKWHVEKKGIN
jgi:dienelactone hydrolase